jgi:uncharacterized protein (DUF433 family)
MAEGAKIEDVLLMYPHLTKENILAIILFSENAQQ